MKSLIIQKLKDIKAEEYGFLTKQWEEIMVAIKYKNIIIIQHISGIDFNTINDKGLLILYEYIVVFKSKNSIQNNIKQPTPLGFAFLN